MKILSLTTIACFFVLASCSTSNVSPQSSSSPSFDNSSISNAYPELPVLQFERTTVSLSNVLDYIRKTDYSTEIKISCYTIFKGESASGRKGINNNYIGYQADGGRVHEEWTRFFIGTVIREESMTGRTRRFLAFEKWQDCVDILLMRIAERGLYVGGHAKQFAKMKIRSEMDWPTAYFRGWVLGDSQATIPRDKYAYYLREYRRAKNLFQ